MTIAAQGVRDSSEDYPEISWDANRAENWVRQGDPPWGAHHQGAQDESDHGGGWARRSCPCSERCAQNEDWNFSQVSLRCTKPTWKANCRQHSLECAFSILGYLLLHYWITAEWSLKSVRLQKWCQWLSKWTCQEFSTYHAWLLKRWRRKSPLRWWGKCQ